MSNPSPEKKVVIKVVTVSIVMLLLSYSVIFYLIRGVIEQESMLNMIQKSRALTVQLEQVRHTVSGMVAEGVFDPGLLTEAQKYIQRKGAKSKDEIIKVARLTRFYQTIPIVSSLKIAQTRSTDAHYQFRVVRVGARNPNSEATPIEKKMLEKMAEKNLPEHWQIDQEKNALRYMRAIIMKKECLLCHGTEKDYPQGKGYDPLGIKMERWSLGEQRGAFEIISDLKPLQEAVRRVQHTLIGIGVVLVILLIFSAPFWFNILLARKKT
ncbi:MAG: DUF3365 domain-containing protein [Magnetococcales bacterium]|nr:DUF3365 domain-containing protein [Magnetococcales bacterium]